MHGQTIAIVMYHSLSEYLLTKPLILTFEEERLLNQRMRHPRLINSC